MNKTLLTLMGSLLYCSSVIAYTPNITTLAVPAVPAASGSQATGQLRGPIKDVGYELTFSGDLYTWAALDDDPSLIYQMFVYVSPDIATQLAGNELTEITLSCAFVGEIKEHPGTVFVSEDLSAGPLTSTDVTIVNNYNAESLTNTFALETPYTIKEGTGFYYGYTITGCETDDYPVGLGKNDLNQFAGGINVYDGDGVYLGSMTLADTFGYNLYLSATTVGAKRELLNLVNFALSGASFELPVVKAGDGIDLRLNLSNLGDNKITYIEYVLDCGKGEPTKGSNICSLKAGKSTTIKIKSSDIAEGRGNVKVTVTMVNEEEKDFGTLSSDYIAMAEGQEGYPRKFVVEEATGTWCGWCPRGIVGLDYMSKTYPDTFIGIGVHSGDNLETETYLPFINKYVEGFPTCVVNRDPNFVLDPSSSELESAYKKWQTQTGVAMVEIDDVVLADDNASLSVTTSTTFAYNEENGDYRLAYVVIEDNLPGVQQNYYSGGGYGSMDGWESKASSVAWRYTDTARGIYDCFGIDGSVTPAIANGVADKYTYDVPMTSVKVIDNSSVVVMLLDGVSGTVLNAAKVKAADYTMGISDVLAESDFPAQYYNLQGMLMHGATLPAGVYIVRQGDKVTKRIIR